MGDRTIEADGSIQFEDLTNNIKAVIVFSTYKKTGFFKKTESGSKDRYTGLIYECAPITQWVSDKQLFSKNAETISDL